MDYLKYDNQVQQPQKPQLTKDDFCFGDLTNKPQQDIFNSPLSSQENSSDGVPEFFNTQTQKNEFGDEVVNLFPVPVMICSCPFKYDEELKMIRQEPCRKDERLISYNNISDNTFVLNRPELERIRSWIETKIQIFRKSILGYKNNLIITQSWVNKNNKNEQHHLHSHPNSIVSGVWYPYIHDKLPPIEFHDNREREVQPERETFNIFNSGAFMLPMKMGELILFPSNLKHSVPTNIFDEERISLSFNTWTKGDLGEKRALTYLPSDI
tara:strand:+ start:130 stop:933 length:804 start_codon:yes stop_codon:yes gene_type:complete